MSALGNFQNNLKRLHQNDKGIVARIAAAIGTSRSQINKYLNGTEPGLDAAENVALAAGTSLAEMIGKEKPEFAAPRDPTPDEQVLFIVNRIGLSDVKMKILSLVLAAEDGDKRLSSLASTVTELFSANDKDERAVRSK